MNNPRYDGKPLLRLVELWILWVIGEIDKADEKKMKAMEPYFEKTWGHQGDWHEMIQATLHLPTSLPDQLRKMWQRNLELAQKENVPPPTEMFVRQIADQISGYAP
jgi:hypothetical protein